MCAVRASGSSDGETGTGECGEFELGFMTMRGGGRPLAMEV
jgi:hypothetical protein